MKKYIPVLVLAALLAFGSVKADTLINGQIMTTVSANPSYKPYMVTVAVPGTGQVYNASVSSFDPVANVPQGLYIAHIATSKATIDVQRFIDPSTSIACYYSEIAGTLEDVSCVPVVR